MSELFFEFGDAFRGFRRDRLYAVAVIGTLALTLGASTAVFSIFNGVLLQPLAYREAQRLVSIREINPAAADRYPTLPVSPRHFEEWRHRATSFSAMVELDWRTTNLTGAGDPAQIVVLRTSGALFDVFGTHVAIGRGLTLDDERADRPEVAVVTDRLWRERLGRDPAVLGRNLTLGGRPYTIVGVLPAGYELPTFDVLSDTGSLTSKLDAIVPMRLDLTKYDWMGEFNFPVVARLTPGVSLEQARAEMNVVQHAVAQIAERETHESVALRADVTPLDESIVGRARLGLVLLLGAIGAVVLIACSNLANLSLTRTLGRMRDAAVRSALGASRARLVRQVVFEQLVLASAGGALGMLVAREALNLFVRTAPIDLPRASDVVIDGRVLAFAAAVAIVAGLAVALLPAWRLGRGDVQATLRGGGHGTTDRGGFRMRAALVGLQVGLSVTLLVVTGLFVTSFVRLLGIDPGFSTDRVVTVEVSPMATRYADARARAGLYDRILDRARRLPGITSLAWTSALPLTGETWVDVIQRPDGMATPSQHSPIANYRFVGPDYFRTLSMPILEGRSIEDRDRRGAATPAVISSRAAETLWPGRDPVGHQFSRGNPDEHFLVVGIVADGHATQIDAVSPLMVYVPYWYNNEGKSVLVAHTTGDATAVVSELRQAIRDVDPETAIADSSPLQHVVDKSLEGRRYQMWLFVAFGAIALLIATVGVYATTAYGVSRRRREMNIRVALGARVSQVFGLVLRQSATPVAVGLAAGCAGALAIGTLVASLLYQVRASDPFVITAVVALVGAVGLLASAMAARQGLRINPAAALRDE
ncbi:MAG TPA: ABC transporter permease [Vicinamibacterales bacterium]|nr:ABC transporter permease [Vicinamibacterales bacterium]